MSYQLSLPPAMSAAMFHYHGGDGLLTLNKTFLKPSRSLFGHSVLSEQNKNNQYTGSYSSETILKFSLPTSVVGIRSDNQMHWGAWPSRCGLLWGYMTG